MAQHPRILATAAAYPAYSIPQRTVCDWICERTFGPTWSSDPQFAERRRRLQRLFAASGVERRQSAVDFLEYYQRPRTTGERMADYRREAYPLACAALDAALADLARQVDATPAAIAASIRDLLVVSCTGYHAPGLDILLARDRGMPRDVRRVVIGHMGCYGGLVGMRQALAALRAHPGGTVALVCVELCSLHFTPSLDSESLTGYALFGDAAASALLTNTDDARAGSAEASGAEIVDVYCATEFDSIEQMSWTVTDTGFVMGLSPRVPVTLRRAVRGAVERLLAPHGLRPVDVTHWMVHPGGPSILEVVQAKLELSDEQMAPSRRVLREHGNCSSPTILMILDDVIRSRTTRPGEWGVMMAFGPGLTLELCLVRF